MQNCLFEVGVEEFLYGGVLCFLVHDCLPYLRLLFQLLVEPFVLELLA